MSIRLPDRRRGEAPIAAAEAGKAIPVLDALAESAHSGQPVDVRR